MRCLCLSILTFIISVRPSVGGEPIRHSLPSERGAQIQAQIEQVVNVLVDPNVDPPEKMRSVGTLVQLSKHDELFFRQLFDYVCRQGGRANVVEERQLAAMKLAHWLDISQVAIATAVIPHIDDDDETVRLLARDFLEIIEKAAPAGTRDYSYYRAFLDADPPLSLVHFMYRRAPGTALLTLAGAYAKDTGERRQVLWSEHVLSDVLWKHRHGFLDKNEVPNEAAAELEKLARHEAWWVRLYVAEILRQHAQFRTPELIERLKADEHELVRRAILEIDKSKSQK